MSQRTDFKMRSRAPMVGLAPGVGDASPGMDAMAKRRLIAEVCKVVGTRVGAVMPDACTDPRLSRRQRETLRHLLEGDLEKQVAAKLGVSRHTIHVYVKALYRHFGVSSRGELLAKCLSHVRSP